MELVLRIIRMLELVFTPMLATSGGTITLLTTDPNGVRPAVLIKQFTLPIMTPLLSIVSIVQNQSPTNNYRKWRYIFHGRFNQMQLQGNDLSNYAGTHINYDIDDENVF